MALTEPDDQRVTSRFSEQTGMWKHLFVWFVHDLIGPISRLTSISDDRDIVRSQAGGGSCISPKEWDGVAQSLRLSLAEFQSFFSVATTIAFHERWRGSEMQDLTRLVSLVSSCIRRHHQYTTYNTALRSTIHTEDSLLASPPILIRTAPAEAVVSHILLFAHAIARPDTSVQISAGKTPFEITFSILIRPPGLNQADIDYIWSPPDRFIKGEYPTRLFRNTDRGYVHSNFSACLAIPAALLAAPSVPCYILPELSEDGQLTITVSFG